MPSIWFPDRESAIARRDQLKNAIDHNNAWIANFNEKYAYGHIPDAAMNERNARVAHNADLASELRLVKSWLLENREQAGGARKLLARCHVTISKALTAGRPLTPTDVADLLDLIQAEVGTDYLRVAHERAGVA